MLALSSLANQRTAFTYSDQSAVSSSLHLRLLHRLQETDDCSEDVTNNVAWRSVHWALKGSTESQRIVGHLNHRHSHSRGLILNDKFVIVTTRP